MDTQLLTTLAQVAGVGGVALGVFLLIFRDIIRKKIFPQLTKQQAFRLLVLMLVLTWSVAIVGIVAWIWVSNGEPPNPVAEAQQINVNLWEVDLDAKGDVVASTQLQIDEGRSISRADLEHLGPWIEAEVGVPDLAVVPPASLSILVPEDPGTDPPTLELSVDADMNVMMWIVDGAAKIRAPLTPESLAGWGRDFVIEAKVPGYELAIWEIVWGDVVDETVDLRPTTVKIAVEGFEGGVGIGDLLTGILNERQRLQVTSPEQLEALREELRENRALIAQNPAAQVSLRLGSVEYIIGGSVRTVSRDQ